MCIRDRLRIERELPDPKSRAHLVRDVLRSLGEPQKDAPSVKNAKV